MNNLYALSVKCYITKLIFITHKFTRVMFECGPNCMVGTCREWYSFVPQSAMDKDSHGLPESDRTVEPKKMQIKANAVQEG